MTRLFLLFTLLTGSFGTSAASDLPRLVVIISVDQLRRDRLTDDLPGFLGRLAREGRVFADADLDHAITTTCPGHAVIVTGVSPGRAGIPDNRFVDQETFEDRYCVDDKNNDYGVLGGKGNRSPRNLRVSTLGDWMKDHDPDSKVFSISGKDRAAIMMGGHKADGVYWYDARTGRFTTSGYYAHSLPDYITAFNGKQPLVDGHLRSVPETWIHPEGSLRKDDYEGESDSNSRISGHALASGDDEDIFEQIYNSPVIDTQSIRLAELIVENEPLGEREGTDLLTISLSSTDIVGHNYGPRSAEAEDTLRNIDELLDEFVADLESKLGENLLVALTADHGVAELTEYKTEQGTNNCPEPGRLSILPGLLGTFWHAYKEFTFPFDMPNDLIKNAGPQVYLNRRYLRDNELEYDEVLASMRTYFLDWNVMKGVWTREEILEGNTNIARLFRNSLTDDRSGDLTLQIHRDCTLVIGSGTTHGSVYDYDRDVPVVFYGWGVDAKEVRGPAHSVDIGPTLAGHLGISMPDDLDGKILLLAD